MGQTKNIVILGGSFAGVAAAHHILRHVTSSLPSMERYQVVMISPSKHFYFRVAAPRAISRPDLIAPETLMPEIEPGFSEYPPNSFRFIQAYANAVDLKARIVTVSNVNVAAGSLDLTFEALIIATGTASESPLWSPRGPMDETIKEMQATQETLHTAQDIVISGGGATGVEIAGEIGFDWGKKTNITLLSGADRLLTVVRPALGSDAESYLQSMGVKVVHQVRVHTAAKDKDGKTVLTLSDGRTMTTDLFLNATGGKPNTGFLPQSMLDKRGYVETDKYLRVTAAGPNVYALGSVASYSNGGLLDVKDAIAPLCSNLEYDLSGGRSGSEQLFTRTTEREMIVVPVGRSKSVGVLFGFKIPSWLGWLLKGRTFFASNAEPYVMGATVKK